VEWRLSRLVLMGRMTSMAEYYNPVRETFLSKQIVRMLMNTWWTDLFHTSSIDAMTHTFPGNLPYIFWTRF
jgi:hypothetical protein